MSHGVKECRIHLLSFNSRHLLKNREATQLRQIVRVIMALAHCKTRLQMKGWGKWEKGANVYKAEEVEKQKVPTVTQQVQPEPNANKGYDYKVLKKWRKSQTNRKKMKRDLLFRRDGFWKVRAHRGELLFPCACASVYMSISGLTSLHHTEKTVSTSLHKQTIIALTLTQTSDNSHEKSSNTHTFA